MSKDNHFPIVCFYLVSGLLMHPLFHQVAKNVHQIYELLEFYAKQPTLSLL